MSASTANPKMKGRPLKDPKSRVFGRQPLLEDYVTKQVTVITNDGRNIVGVLRGIDQVCNIILEKSEERVFASDSPVQFVSLGLYVIRGDNIAVVGLVDQDKEEKTQWQSIKVSQFYPNRRSVRLCSQFPVSLFSLRL